MTKLSSRADEAVAAAGSRYRWRHLVDLSRFERSGARFVDDACAGPARACYEDDYAPVPFCGAMTKGWSAAKLAVSVPKDARAVRLGRAHSGVAGPGGHQTSRCLQGVDRPRMGRGDAAAADADIPKARGSWRGWVAATPRRQTRIVRKREVAGADDGSRRRRGGGRGYSESER